MLLPFLHEERKACQIEGDKLLGGFFIAHVVLAFITIEQSFLEQASFWLLHT